MFSDWREGRCIDVADNRSVVKAVCRKTVRLKIRKSLERV